MSARSSHRVSEPAAASPTRRGSSARRANDSPRPVTAARVELLRRQLTARDYAIVDTLDRLRLATTAQLGRLHVTDGTPASNARQIRRVLARLVSLGVVSRLDRQVGGVRAGSAAYVYTLDVAGQYLASMAGPAGGRRLRRPWTPGLAFIAHRLAVSEVYVELVEAERTGALELLAFDAEPFCWRRSGTDTLKPDAFVRLGVGAYEHAAFVELDRATESGPAITRKLRAYVRHFRNGAEQARFGFFPQVVFLVPDESRRAALAALIARQPAPVRPLFRVALAAAAVAALTSADETKRASTVS
ncbi:MAG: replication-relaxation family protein [Conexibacter sp.]